MEVNLETFQRVTGITQMSFHDDDESIENDIESGYDISLHLATFKGHTIGMVKHQGTPFYMTPMGFSPDRIPQLVATPKLIDEQISRSTFDITVDNLPGSLLAHGTSASHAESLSRDGMSHERTIKGYMGKGFYTTPNGEYAFSYAVDDAMSNDLSKNDDACAVVVKVNPGARILVDGDPRFAKIQDEWSRDDFHDRVVHHHGIDIMVVPAFDTVCIYNPEAIEIIGTVSKAEMREYRQSLKNDSEMSP